MRTRTRVGLIVAALTAVGLALDYIGAATRHVEEKHVRTTQCETWCPCKCHQPGCGCHENKPRPKVEGYDENGVPIGPGGMDMRPYL